MPGILPKILVSIHFRMEVFVRASMSHALKISAAMPHPTMYTAPHATGIARRRHQARSLADS
jgi:uncharacterized protein (UPF0212 family)